MKVRERPGAYPPLSPEAMVAQESFPSSASPLGKNLSRHRVLISDDPAQWRRVVRAFLGEGLARGEPCLCLYHLYLPSSICTFLAGGGAEVISAQERGLLSFSPATEVFNHEGVFSPATCLGALVKAGRGTVSHRRQPLRVVTDMNWAADSRLNHLRLLVYEDLLNRRLLPHFPVDLLCYYNRALFPPSFLAQVAARHTGQVPALAPAGAGSGLPVPLNGGSRRPLRLAAV